MKAKMYSAASNTRLHKIIDELSASHEGINNLRKAEIIEDKEYVTMMEKNISHFFLRIKEFRLAEKMLCVFFACLFGYMQLAADDLDIQRKGRRSRSRNRRNEKLIDDGEN